MRSIQEYIGKKNLSMEQSIILALSGMVIICIVYSLFIGARKRTKLKKYLCLIGVFLLLSKCAIYHEEMRVVSEKELQQLSEQWDHILDSILSIDTIDEF